MPWIPKNTIGELQNEQVQLERLAAATSVYSRAKKLVALQVILSIPAALFWALLLVRYPNLKVWAVFYSLTYSLVDALVLEGWLSKLRVLGAKFQELFDGELYRMDWRGLKLGERPDSEVLYREMKRYAENDPSLHDLKNWYPPRVSQLPLPFGRLLCQRASTWWDATLRRRYSAALKIVLAVLSVLVFGIALYRGATVEELVLTGFAPLAPAILWTFREVTKQDKAAKALDRLRTFIEAVWEQGLDEELDSNDLYAASVEIQNEIFDNRSRNPLIFNWINQRLKPSHEAEMNRKAEELVTTALGQITLIDVEARLNQKEQDV